MSRKQTKRPAVDPETRAFRDAVRDIVESEGWFELALDGAGDTRLRALPRLGRAGRDPQGVA
jgi:hypothetical protein